MENKKATRLQAAVLVSIAAALLTGNVSWAQTEAGKSAQAAKFNIPAGDLATALKAFGEQSNTDVLFDPQLAASKRTAGLVGQHETSEGLRILLAEAGLTFRVVDGKTVLIESGENGMQPAKLNSTRVGESSQAAPSQGVGKGGTGMERENSQSEGKDALQEIVVTGTHIRGVTNSASPVHVYSRDDIDRTGLGSVQEFIQRLPQNFNGGASEDTIAGVTGGASVTNTVAGTGINLRGLGNDSTLVLVNGRRVAPGNGSGNFVDVSMIPLSAVERIEVVSDGASAIYGSDAVGGVVNFILRRNFDGAETRARYGSVGQGSSHELQLGQAFGQTWENGSALIGYEYFDRTPLSASDRSFSRAAVQPFTLLPDQTRHSAFLSIDHAISSGIGLFADASYAKRDTSTSAATSFFQLRTPATIESYGGTIGTRIGISDRSQLELSGTHTASDSRTASIFAGQTPSRRNVNTRVTSFDAKLDGELWSAPAGAVRFAVGAQYRDESYENVNPDTGTRIDSDRNLTAAFAELRVPIIGPSSSSPSGSRLELSLADRYEEYSDFGSTNNPEVGAVWRPTSSFAMRATYGTSFKAPNLLDLNGSPIQAIAVPQFDPVSGSDTNTIIVFGGDQRLTPEKAKSWTLGIDMHSLLVEGLQASLSYYNINFDDRIVDVGSSIDVFDALRNEPAYGPQVIQRNPSQAYVQELAATPGFEMIGDFELSTVAAIVNAGVLNLSKVKTSGLDIDIKHSVASALGEIETGVNATYVLTFDSHFTSTSPAVDTRNTPFNPVDLRLRGHAMLHRGDISVGAFLNYIDSYTDRRGVSPTKVASWTTVDATIGYEFGEESSLLSDLSVMLAVTNLTDKDPPYVLNRVFAINFDGANANALGRFYSVQLSKRW